MRARTGLVVAAVLAGLVAGGPGRAGAGCWPRLRARPVGASGTVLPQLSPAVPVGAGDTKVEPKKAAEEG